MCGQLPALMWVSIRLRLLGAARPVAMCSGLVGVLRPAASLVVWHSRSGFGLPRCLASGECDIGWSACWGAPLRDKWGGGRGDWVRGCRHSTLTVARRACWPAYVGWATLCAPITRCGCSLALYPQYLLACSGCGPYSTYRFSRSYAWRHSSRRTLLTNDI